MGWAESTCGRDTCPLVQCGMVLLFDVMDTLVRDPFRDMPAFFGMTLAEMLEAKHPTAWVDFESGHIDEPTFLARFFADGRSYDHDAFRAYVRQGYRLLEGTESLLTELRSADVPVHLLSNYPCWYRMVEERLGLSRFAKWSFVSCETGLRKPEPEAYLHAARGLAMPPEACLFVDDRKRNCAAARAVGMDAIRFVDTAALRDELALRGIP